MLDVGKKAPDFSLLNQDEKKISLKDFIGQKVVLYFYPKDDTSGCTKKLAVLVMTYQNSLKLML